VNRPNIDDGRGGGKSGKTTSQIGLGIKMDGRVHPHVYIFFLDMYLLNIRLIYYRFFPMF
jgi:hypothetical protein